MSRSARAVSEERPICHINITRNDLLSSLLSGSNVLHYPVKAEVIVCVRGVISPCLANVFLHHVLDEWFVREVKPRLRGHCFIVRFAEDFVIGFQREDDARRVMDVLPKRFAKYGLEIHPEKSRLLAFGKPASGKEVTRGDNTFDFLGFTHYWARSRNGNWIIKRKTARKKVRKTVQALRIW